MGRAMAAATNGDAVGAPLSTRPSIMSDGLIERVGRCGDLVLSFEQRRGHTELNRVHCRSPWHFMPPMALDGGRCAYTMLVNPSGGLVGGDRLSLTASIGSDAHVLFSTPSATRIYRTIGPEAVQEITLRVGENARLEWLPDVTIPYAGSCFRQSIDVSLAPGAALLFWDALACGRVACDERWAFAQYRNEIRIRTASGGEVLERVALTPHSNGVGSAEPWNYVASLFVVADPVAPSVREDLERDLDECIEQHFTEGELLAAVSELPVPGLVVKVLTRTAPSLHELYGRAWAVIRKRLWNRDCPALRRY
ncbi:MAG: urease accessory protein UreD [Nitrospiraceae bacterium]